MELKADFENTHQQQQQLQQEAKVLQQQKQQEEAKVEEQRQMQLQQQQQQQTFHVLAVDDSLIDRKLLEKLLRVSSYQVTCVDSGDKALEYLGLLDNLDNDSTTSSSPKYSSHKEGSRVNLIMTDYCMPGMSGYDLLKRVKGSYWKDVPVVVMSSENEPSRISRCLEGGAEEFLLKPLQLSDLEKLQPHLLRSLDRTDNNKINDNNDNNDNDDNNNNNNNEINNFIGSNNNNAFSKRKAFTAEIPERRPKMKELAVV